jgi:hypothetical protein
MESISACDIPVGLGHHVYVLFSRTRPNLVKVGRSKSAARIRKLRKMNYADVADWDPYEIVALETQHAAVALEAMTHARLANQGFRIARFRWTRLPDYKECLADECFCCSALHAAAAVKEMLAIYNRSVA